MSNTTKGMLLCPILQDMQGHSLNNNKQANLVVVVIHGLVSCLGILENALVLWVVGFRLQRRTVSSVWVLNLAMSDFLATLTLPFFTSYLYHSHSWELGNPLCKTQASIFFVNMFVSAFLLAAISLDRLLLVVKPVWSQNHRSVAGAWKVCALGWLWAAINATPYAVFRSVTEKQDGGNLCYHNFALLLSSETSLERDCEVRQAVTAISKLLLAFLFPLVMIAGSYIQIGLFLKSRSQRRKQSATITTLSDALIASKKGTTARTPTKRPVNIFLRSSSTPQATTPTIMPLATSNHTSQGMFSQSFIRMVTFVITAFVLCWAPYHIFCVIEVAAHYQRNMLQLVEVGLPLVTTIAFLNPVLNPILYAFSCPHFCVRIRQSLGAVFDGLVEEEVGFITAPGKGLRAHVQWKSSRDVNFLTKSPRKSRHIQQLFPLPLVCEGTEDT